MRLVRDLETVDRRVLGALRAVDATSRRPVARPLTVEAEGARLWRNARGDYVIARAPGLRGFLQAWDKLPAEPAAGSIPVVFTIQDPSGHYLPRLVTVPLPRDPDPAHAEQPASLFQPHIVELYPGPGIATAPAWAAIRVSVTRAVKGGGAPGALLRITYNRPQDDAEIVALGLTDRRGEGLVAIPGIPFMIFGADEEGVLVSEVAATLDVIYDDTGVDDLPPVIERVVDPDRLSERPAATTRDITLAPGREIPLELEV